MCSQLCGVGHPNMRAVVVVEDAAGYQAWLQDKQTFAVTQRPPSTEGGPVGQGRALAAAKGCVACHSIDGSPRVGPTWKDLFGKTENMRDGSTAFVDDAYLRAFIRDPQARGVKGFAPVMPKIPLSDEEVAALVAYIKSLSPAPPMAPPQQKAQR
jgi:cytochrome c oxidase subunit II